MTLTEAMRNVGRFLFSRANKEFMIFLFFFAIAGVFWLLESLNESYEQELKIMLNYRNVPKNAVLTSLETDTLHVTVTDKGINLLPYLYNKEKKTVTIDFQAYAHNGTGTVPLADLRKKLDELFTASTRITAVKPEKFTFTYNNGEWKRVPVKLMGHVSTDELYFLAETRIRPDSVTVYAQKHVLDTIAFIATEPVSVKGLNDTLTIAARLEQRTGLKTVPTQVNVRFVTDILTEGSVSGIPIVGINMPEGKVLRTFPSKVEVYFVTGMKTYQGLKPRDFLVVADYNEIARNQLPKCNIYLRQQPRGIKNVRLSAQQIDYLIEDRP